MLWRCPYRRRDYAVCLRRGEDGTQSFHRFLCLGPTEAQRCQASHILPCPAIRSEIPDEFPPVLAWSQPEQQYGEG